MSDSMSEPNTTRRRFRPFWTLVAVGIVLVMEAVRYFGGGVQPEVNQQRPAPVPAQREALEAETEKDDAQTQNEKEAN